MAGFLCQSNVRLLVFPHYNGPPLKGAIMRLEVDDEDKKKALQRRVQASKLEIPQNRALKHEMISLFSLAHAAHQSSATVRPERPQRG